MCRTVRLCIRTGREQSQLNPIEETPKSNYLARTCRAKTEANQLERVLRKADREKEGAGGKKGSNR